MDSPSAQEDVQKRSELQVPEYRTTSGALDAALIGLPLYSLPGVCHPYLPLRQSSSDHSYGVEEGVLGAASRRETVLQRAEVSAAAEPPLQPVHKQLLQDLAHDRQQADGSVRLRILGKQPNRRHSENMPKAKILSTERARVQMSKSEGDRPVVGERPEGVVDSPAVGARQQRGRDGGDVDEAGGRLAPPIHAEGRLMAAVDHLEAQLRQQVRQRSSPLVLHRAPPPETLSVHVARQHHPLDSHLLYDHFYI